MSRYVRVVVTVVDWSWRGIGTDGRRTPHPRASRVAARRDHLVRVSLG